jgi:hypothetical protein
MKHSASGLRLSIAIRSASRAKVAVRYFAQRLEQSPIKREGHHGHAGDKKSYRGQPND